jgi:hypothetical protein
MKITIEPTTKMVQINGIPARIWEGVSDSGIPVHCYVTRIAVPKDMDCAQFDRELSEQRAPSAEVEAIPLRVVL